eukprot:1154628-Pelagomonas_calceolata.AAC.6
MYIPQDDILRLMMKRLPQQTSIWYGSQLTHKHISRRFSTAVCYTSDMLFFPTESHLHAVKSHSHNYSITALKNNYRQCAEQIKCSYLLTRAARLLGQNITV